MSRRLEDRIKELCARAVSTPESPELNQVLKDLQAALHEHTQRLRKTAFNLSVRPEPLHGRCFVSEIEGR
jgi:hypothetical protein